MACGDVRMMGHGGSVIAKTVLAATEARTCQNNKNIRIGGGDDNSFSSSFLLTCNFNLLLSFRNTWMLRDLQRACLLSVHFVTALQF
jgi:hypothetical protein